MNDQIPRPKTIRELLGMDPEPGALPIVTQEELENIKNPEPSGQAPAPVNGHALEKTENQTEVIQIKLRRSFSRFFSRDMIRYPLIFIVALAFFYGLLNFRALYSQVAGLISRPPKNTEAVLGAHTEEFNNWIQKYYVYVTNPEILSPNEDADGDGLTNMDEFYLGTNPLNPDTDGEGGDDGQEIISGQNPLYSGPLTAKQREIVQEKIGHKDIEDRRSFDAREVRAATISESEIPRLPVSGNFPLDPTRPGHINIPRLGVEAQVTWSKEFSQMEADLKYGTAHHPATKYPGERGLSSIHGHSSGNFDDGNFKTVFTKINFLEPGDEIFVTVYSSQGESRRYRYIVRSKKVYEKKDPQQFTDHGGSHLNLSTSWPIGTARQRYVVTTELAGL